MEMEEFFVWLEDLRQASMIGTPFGMDIGKFFDLSETHRALYLDWLEVVA